MINRPSRDSITVMLIIMVMPWLAGSAIATGSSELAQQTPAIGQTSSTLPGRDSTPVAPIRHRIDRGGQLADNWPIDLAAPNGGFPYTPTLFDADGDGADEIFLTGGHTFALEGDGSFMPGWPTTEMLYMGYGTNGNKPGPSVANVDLTGDCEVFWSERDWWAGSAIMWSFNGKNLDGSNRGSFPQSAPDESSNALDTPFVLGDTDGDGDLEAWGAHTLGNTGIDYRISGFDHLGNLLFTTDLSPGEDVISLYFGDLDGDGTDEMFAVSWLDPTSTIMLHAFAADGSELAGYPQPLYTMSSGYLMFGPPIPTDLDDDGDLEILLGYNGGGGMTYARAHHHDGTLCTGYPLLIATSSQLFFLGMGDLTADGEPELIAFDNHLGSNYRVHVFDLATGTLLPGWPFALADWPKGFPAVADVDNDAVQDICLVTDGGELYALSGDGLVLPGYPYSMVSPSISGVGVGDIDADGLFELVAATWDGWVYAWDTSGAALPGRADWPLRGIDARNSGVFDPTGGSTGVAVATLPPAGLHLRQNRPNPFLQSTRIEYTLPHQGHAELSIFDCAGRLVRRLALTGSGTAGEQAVVWDGRSQDGQLQSTGVYFYRLETDAGTVTREMLLIK